MLHDCFGQKPNFALRIKELGELDTCCYFGSCISPGVRSPDEAPSRIQNAQLVFTGIGAKFECQSIVT